MSQRLYVGNLAPTVDERDLRRAFEERGHPLQRVQLVQDPATGRGRGFAFVELASERQAARAAEDLEGARLAGRRLHVDSVPRPHRTRFVGERIERGE